MRKRIRDALFALSSIAWLSPGLSVKFVTAAALSAWTGMLPFSLLMIALVLVVPGGALDRLAWLGAGACLLLAAMHWADAVKVRTLSRLLRLICQKTVDRAPPGTQTASAQSVESDRAMIEDLMLGAVPPAVAEGLLWPFYVAGVLWAVPWLAFLAVAELGLLALVLDRQMESLEPLEREHQDARTQLRAKQDLAVHLGAMTPEQTASALLAAESVRTESEQLATARLARMHRFQTLPRIVRTVCLTLATTLLAYLMIRGGLTPVAALVGWFLLIRASAAAEGTLRSLPSLAQLGQVLRQPVGTIQERTSSPTGRIREIQLENLCLTPAKHVGAQRCVVRAGEIVVISGHNGSGKSLLCQILAGRTPPPSGRVAVLFEDTQVGDPASIHRGQLQQRPITTSASVREVMAPWLDRSDSEEKFTVYLNTLPIPASEVIAALPQRSATPWANVAPVLGQGVQRVLEIAMVFNGDPQLLVLDDPFNLIDARWAAVLWRALLDQAGRGRIVFVASNHRSGLEYASRWWLLREGVIHEQPALDRQRGDPGSLAGIPST